jgi:hypothetical protein
MIADYNESGTALLFICFNNRQLYILYLWISYVS